MAVSSYARLTMISSLTALIILLISNCNAEQQSVFTVSPNEISGTVIQSALKTLNDSKLSYRSIALISALRLVNPPYAINKLIFKLVPICKDGSNCLDRACMVSVRQHDEGIVDVLSHSIQCTDWYPGWSEHDIRQKLETTLEQGIIKNLEKQINEARSAQISEPEEQNDRNFVAIKASLADYCPGCDYEINPTLPGLASFGEQALQSMDDSGIAEFKHKLVSIVRVTRAVPPGSNLIQYKILMEVGESSCLVSSLIERSECPLQSNLPIKMCHVTFVKQYDWNTSVYNKRITSNNCTDFQNDSEALGSSHSHAQTHQEVEAPMKAGEFFDQIAQESQKVKEFDKFLEDFELPIRQVETTLSSRYVGAPEVTETVESIRVRRSVMNSEKSSMGGKAAMRKLAIKVVEMLDEEDDDDKRRMVMDVLETSKERQKNGMTYFLTVEVAPTDCSEKDRKATECLDEVPGPSEICKFSVVVANEKKPLENPKILHTSCRTNQKSMFYDQSRFKRQLLGGFRSIDVNDAEVQKFAKHGLKHYSSHHDGPNEPLIITVKKARVQVVAGNKYEIEVDIGSSNCVKGASSENCQTPKSDGEIKECLISVWSRPWIDKGNPEIDVKCEETKTSRKKRSLRGANYSQKMLKIMPYSKEERLFEEFLNAYEKKYDSEEEKQHRYKIFQENLNFIEELQRNEQGTGRYGVTMFADLTREEFRQRHLGLRPDLLESEQHGSNNIPLPMAEIKDIPIPEEFDWRHHNVVTPVKNQGQCGSCWAFSVTGNIEGQYAIKNGKLISLSEQELLDCDKLDEACNGGLPDSAYRAIEEIGGLETEDDYPYDARKEECHINKNKIRVSIASGLNITTNETKIAQWLVQNGPVSIGINANAMQFYMGGVSHPFKFLCSPKNLDHGVLIVGYGVKNYPIFKKRLPYWIVKNSWGPRWGEQGYYRVFRGDGTCGVNQMVTSAVLN